MSDEATNVVAFDGVPTLGPSLSGTVPLWYVRRVEERTRWNSERTETANMRDLLVLVGQVLPV